MSRDNWVIGSAVKGALRRVPGVHALWQRLWATPATKRWAEDIDLALKYGRLRPDHVRLPGSPHDIFVDAKENRGRAILRGRAGGQPVLKAIWSAAHALLLPGISLDVGVNYGEFLFAPTHSGTRRVIGVEANRLLRPWLDRSREAHPARDRIELVFAVASADAGKDVDFYVDTAWSGRSSTRLDPSSAAVRAERVPTTTIDDLLRDDLALGGPLVFKIDVEGHEAEVLAGMRRTLAAMRPHAGLLEWNPAFIRESGHDERALFAELSTGRVVHAVRTTGEIALVADIGEVQRHLRDREGDLLVVTDAALAERIVAAARRG